MAKFEARRLDPLHAMLLGNLVWGIALGLLFVLGVYLLDLGHIRTLMAKSRDGLLALALLTLGSVVTFASVVMGGAVMLLPSGEDDGPGRGHGQRRGTAGPILLRALVPLRLGATPGRIGPKA